MALTGCAQPNLPGVYAEITSVLSWIQGIIPADCTNVAPGPATTPGQPNPQPTTTNVPNPTTTFAPNPEPTATIAPNPEPTTSSSINGTTGDCAQPQWQGDSFCDDANNNAACNWDGGDCCALTNSNSDMDVYCDDCSCLDPNVVNGECAVPEWQGDSFCDDMNNNAACNWDGGDCCAGTNSNTDKDAYCDDCSCLDPAQV